MKLATFLDSGDLFAELIPLMPELNLGVSASLLNMQTKLDYGHRTMGAGFELLTMKELAELLVANYGEVWGKLDEFNKMSLSNGVKTTETTLSDETGSNESIKTDKVSGYDSAVMVEDSGSDDMTTTANNKTVTLERDVVINNALLAGETINSLTNNVIIKTMLFNIAQFTTLSIS